MLYTDGDASQLNMHMHMHMPSLTSAPALTIKAQPSRSAERSIKRRP